MIGHVIPATESVDLTSAQLVVQLLAHYSVIIPALTEVESEALEALADGGYRVTFGPSEDGYMLSLAKVRRTGTPEMSHIGGRNIQVRSLASALQK